MKPITDDEQRRIFSKNLAYFLSINEMQQKDLAKILDVQPSTVSNWINQTSMPPVSTIQKIADYFKIGKSDSVDEKLEDDPGLDAKILSDIRLMKMVKMFCSLSISDREIIESLIISLYDKSNR